ncbi:tetratricopeptide repeat protein [Psychrobacillus psychrotolerans]|uniref:tetratricopeptide repeat protein n=1 Tax=Psychrobacillus psychrotolerans TaxID=126156 RepID=UPI003315FF6F
MIQKKIQTKPNRNYSNYIFITCIIVVLTVLIGVENVAEKEDNLLLNDFSLYQKADVLLQEGDMESVIPILKELHKTYNDDFNISYRLGYSYLSTNRYDSALVMYTRSLDLNPYFVENKDFLYEYAIILANNEQNDNAIQVIDRLLELPIDENFKGKVMELRDSISINLKGSTT